MAPLLLPLGCPPRNDRLTSSAGGVGVFICVSAVRPNARTPAKTVAPHKAVQIVTAFVWAFMSVSPPRCPSPRVNSPTATPTTHYVTAFSASHPVNKSAVFCRLGESEQRPCALCSGLALGSPVDE